jgi:hypothetical protein
VPDDNDEDPKDLPPPPPPPAMMPIRSSGLSQRMEPLSPLARNHRFATPLTARHQNLAWVNKITSRPFDKDL